MNVRADDFVLNMSWWRETTQQFFIDTFLGDLNRATGGSYQSVTNMDLMLGNIGDSVQNHLRRARS